MDLVIPALFAIFVWWFSTGAILYVDGLPRSTFGWTMIWATLILALAVIGFAMTAHMATVEGAYLAFLCGLLCWGWQELSLYTGHITGPHRSAAPVDLHGWRRFSLATQTILYHEIAIAIMGAGLIWLTWDAPNQVGVWTYVTLWLMRLSAKVNVYLGVTNHAAEFLPDNVAYLQSYFGKQPMNLFFPVSVTVSTLVTAFLFVHAVAADVTAFEATGMALVATLMALAVLEHWFLVMPLPATELWSWGLVSRREKRGAAEKPTNTTTRSSHRMLSASDSRHANRTVTVEPGAFS